LFIKHFCALLLLTSLAAFGGTISFTGPDDVNGHPCTPGVTPDCIAGDPLTYEVFKASITSPATAGGLWTLTLDTNYGVTLPGSSTVIPTYPFEFNTSNPSFGYSDFLISWGGNSYGIVLTAHDGYKVGSMYEVKGTNQFQTSAQAMASYINSTTPPLQVPRPGLFVELAAGGALQGTGGTVSAAANPGSNGVTDGLYTITDTFSAAPNFLMDGGLFTVFASSYVCANGYLTGTTTAFPGGGPPVTTPEPSSWLMILPGLVLLGVGQVRRRRA